MSQFMIRDRSPSVRSQATRYQWYHITQYAKSRMWSRSHTRQALVQTWRYPLVPEQRRVRIHVIEHVIKYIR